MVGPALRPVRRSRGEGGARPIQNDSTSSAVNSALPNQGDVHADEAARTAAHAGAGPAVHEHGHRHAHGTGRPGVAGLRHQFSAQPPRPSRSGPPEIAGRPEAGKPMVPIRNGRTPSAELLVPPACQWWMRNAGPLAGLSPRSPPSGCVRPGAHRTKEKDAPAIHEYVDHAADSRGAVDVERGAVVHLVEIAAEAVPHERRDLDRLRLCTRREAAEQERGEHRRLVMPDA